jgi:hypothetical protein
MNAEAVNPRGALTAKALTAQPRHARTTGDTLRRGLAMGGNVLGLAALVFSIPFVILAVGLPLVLLVQIVLWIARLVF